MSKIPPAPTQDVAAQIRREQVYYLRRGSVLSCLLHPLAAGFIAVAMVGHVGHEVVATWLLLVWSAAAIRTILWQRYRVRVRSMSDAMGWSIAFTAVAVGANLLWAGAAIFMWPQDAPALQMLLFLVIAVVTAVEMVAMASFMVAVVAVLFGTVATLMIALALRGLLVPINVYAVAFYTAVIGISARYINRLLFESLRLRFELAAATAAAQAANKAKAEFIANMSHELRTPLNAIIGFSEIIKGEILGQDALSRYKEYATNIHESGAHLLEIINDILDLSKIEAGKFELKEEKVALDDVVKKTLSFIIDRAEQSGVTVHAEIAQPPPTIRGDERAVKHVLLNLLSNAVKFTPIGGEVSIAVGCDDAGGVRVLVRDTGIGMSPRDIPKAMEAFGQLESAFTRKHPGTGLGLPLVKSLVELHDGQFRLSSEVGVGTTAEILFPPHRVVRAETKRVEKPLYRPLAS